MSYTKGPWRVTHDGYIAAEGYVPIRTPFRKDAFEEGPGRSDHSEETLRANARLIAAAPELLGALKEARNVILLAFGNAAWNDESTDDQDSKDEVLTVLAGMEEAIAKAEGRTP